MVPSRRVHSRRQHVTSVTHVGPSGHLRTMILNMPSLWPTLRARSWPTGATGRAEPGGSEEVGEEGLGGPGLAEEEVGAVGALPAVCVCVV